jgi:hypothetical protein
VKEFHRRLATLGLNYRAFPPAEFAIGPTLEIRDAVAGKMSALYSRGETRDFIDIATVLDSGRYTCHEVLSLADEQESAPLDRATLAGRFRSVRGNALALFEQYDVDGPRRDEILDLFERWADAIDPPVHEPGSDLE